MIDSIRDVLDPGCITMEIQGRKKPEIIAELVDSLAKSGKIKAPDEIVRLVLEREAMMSTGIGSGIAVPHCLAQGVEETVIAFGRSSRGVKFDAVDKKPVQLVFLMVGPSGAHSEHLRLLSKLSRLLHDPTLKSGLLDAATPEAVVEIFGARENSGER